MLLRFCLFYMVNIIAPRLRASLWSWIFGPWDTSKQVGQEAGVGWVDVQGGFSCVEDNIYVRYRLITNWTWFLLCNPCFSSRADWNLTHGYMHKHTHMLENFDLVRTVVRSQGKYELRWRFVSLLTMRISPIYTVVRRTWYFLHRDRFHLCWKISISYVTHIVMYLSLFFRVLCGFPHTRRLPHLGDEVFILFFV